MAQKQTYTSDGGGGRSSYSRSLAQEKSSYQDALSKATKKRLKGGIYEPLSGTLKDYGVGTWDDETEEYYLNGKTVGYDQGASAEIGHTKYNWVKKLKKYTPEGKSIVRGGQNYNISKPKPWDLNIRERFTGDITPVSYRSRKELAPKPIGTQKKRGETGRKGKWAEE